MSNTSAPPRSGHFHAVRFYEDATSLCRIVGEFVRDGLNAGEPALVIATPLHQQGVLKRLAELGEDVQRRQREGELIVLDAAGTMARFIVNGMPNRDQFETAMVAVIEKACRGRRASTVRAYGEMVDLLWQAGMHAATVRLEMFWNQLANTRQFSLLCGYSMGSFYKDAAYDDICGQHTHIVSVQGEAARLH